MDVTLIEGAVHDENGYQVWDDMAVEAEVAEFLYALVRVVKPIAVVESGSGRGIASRSLAAGLRDNGRGHLTTYEPLPEFQQIARTRLDGLPATVCGGYSCDDRPDADLVFLDSAGAERPREILFWLPTGVPMVVHDAHEHRRFLPDSGTLFDTPRGLWLRI